MHKTLDYRGLKCPIPVVKFAIEVRTAPAESTFVLKADCSAFKNSITNYCKTSQLTLINFIDKGDFREATVQI
jgi:TusA-related sulfurtransferase